MTSTSDVPPPRFIADEGFLLRPGPLRPRANLRVRVGRTSPALHVRLARIGAGVIELAAESIGLDALDGREVELEIAELFEPVVGTLAVIDVARAVLVITAPRASAARSLFMLAATNEAPTIRPPPPEEIRDPARILSVVRALVVNEAPGRIRAKEKDFRLRPRRLDSNRVVWDVLEQGGTPTSPLVIECSGYGASYALSVLLAGPWASPLFTTLPRVVHRSRFRRMPRAMAPGELMVRFEHPSFLFTVERRIGDLSEDGLGFRGIAIEDLLCPGLTIPSVQVIRAGEVVATLSATVRSVSRDGERVGLAVHPDGGDRGRDWSRLVRELLHERTRSTGYTADSLWNLYVDAGYLSLSGRKPDDFAALRDSFGRATERLLAAPALGYHVVWPSDRGLDASVANVLVYSRAHLGFQMAKRPGKELGGTVGKEILRDIHWHTLEEALGSSQSDFWIGYVQPNTRFSNLLYCEFQTRFRDPERECVVPIHPAKVELAMEVEPEATEPGFEVGVATVAEIGTICDAIQATFLKPYWESQDFTEERFDLSALKEKWKAAGLERERRAIVIRDPRGVPEAALVAEVAEPGLHLYGLMDIARVIPLVPGGARHTLRLLDAARDYYRSLGRSSFVYFHEGTAPLPSRADLHSMGAASLCVISMTLIPDLLDHLFEHMSWDPRTSLPPPPADRFIPSPSVADLSLLV